jgi:hypothetical protein
MSEEKTLVDLYEETLESKNLKLHAEIDTAIFLLGQVIKNLESVTEEKPKGEPVPNHYEKLKEYTEKLFDGVPPE